MKKITLFLTVLCFYNMTFAQSNFISDHYAHYEKDPTFNTLNVSSKTFSLFTEIETDNVDEQKALGAIAQLDGIKVVRKEKTEQATALFEDAANTIDADGRYEELARVNAQEDDFLFMIREEEDMVKEMTVILGSQQHFLIATLYGDIDLKNISKLMKVIKSQGEDWFAHFENIASEELVFSKANANNKNTNAKKESLVEDMNINVFPNPASDHIWLQPKETTSTTYQLQFFSIIGEPVKNIGAVTLPYKIHLEDLPSGAYFLRLTDEQGAFKNYRIVKP